VESLWEVPGAAFDGMPSALATLLAKDAAEDATLFTDDRIMLVSLAIEDRIDRVRLSTDDSTEGTPCDPACTVLADVEFVVAWVRFEFIVVVGAAVVAAADCEELRLDVFEEVC
jgi:hypothetical protein